MGDTFSFPPPPPRGPSGDEWDRQSRKRKPEEEDMPQDTKRSRVTSLEIAEYCSYCNMNRLVALGQYQEALACTRTNVSSDSSKAKLQRYLQKTMILLISGEGRSCEVLGLDYADVMMYLLSERLEDYTLDDEDIFSEFCSEYLRPNYTETLLKLVNKHTTNLTDKRRVWRTVFRDVVQIIVGILQLISDFTQADMPDDLQECQEQLTHLVQILPATLHDDSDPATSLSWLHENSTRTIVDYAPIFAKAVELRLVQEAKLLYEAGAVNNAELTTVANKPEVQKMLTDEEDQSKMTVFLRKVLKQPRRLDSMALLRVSRLVGQDVLGREDRVRQLPLPSILREAVLLRTLVNRYRKETECNDQNTDGGV